jgi:hypothetical protein
VGWKATLTDANRRPERTAAEVVEGDGDAQFGDGVLAALDHVRTPSRVIRTPATTTSSG